MDKIYCNSFFIELSLKDYNNLPYIDFNFCCQRYVKLLSYPLEDVCKDFDYYIDRCHEMIAKNEICKKCNKYSGFDITDRERLAVSIAVSLICSQNCSFCGRRNYRTTEANKYNKFKNWCSDKLLEAVSNSKHVITVVPSSIGEPFEDPYIKNTFVFNLHKSNIKHIIFLTNAVHAEDIEYLKKLKNYLDEHNIKARFSINCSGLSRRVYESYCTSNFKRVKRNIKNIYDVFGDCFIIHYIVSKHNEHLPRKKICKQFKITFPYLKLKNLDICLDYTYFTTVESYTKACDRYLRKDKRITDLKYQK